MKPISRKHYKLSNQEIISLMDFIEQQYESFTWSQIDRMLAEYLSDMTLGVYDHGNSKVVLLTYCTINTKCLAHVDEQKLVMAFIDKILRKKVECIYSNVEKFLEDKEESK